MHLHADDFWHCIVSGAVSPHLPESDEQNQVVMRAIRQAAFTYAAGGLTTVIDGIIGPWMLEHFRDSSGSADVPRLHYVVLRPDREEAVRRGQRRAASDALVDEESLVSLWGQFADPGPLERRVIDTTEQEPADAVRTVADAFAGERFFLTAG